MSRAKSGAISKTRHKKIIQRARVITGEEKILLK